MVTHTLIRTWGPGACSLMGEGGCEGAGGAAWRLEATDRDSQRENSVVENKCTPNPGQTHAWNSTADPQGPCPRSQHLQFLGEDKMFSDDHTHHLNGELQALFQSGELSNHLPAVVTALETHCPELLLEASWVASGARNYTRSQAARSPPGTEAQ